MAVDRFWMQRALQLAEKGLYTTTPNPRVGCVLINPHQDADRGGLLLGEGFHERAGEGHAEVMAIRQAQAQHHILTGATAYVTLEPCNHHGRTPPCTETLIATGIQRVVIAMRDPNPQVQGRGVSALLAAGLQVTQDICTEEAQALNQGFIKRMTTGQPWLRLKLASSLDGIIALRNGQSRWITGQAARDDGHHWRARACAVLTGIGTVLADDPHLNVRAVATTRQPMLIILDRHLRCPPQAKLFDVAERQVLLVHQMNAKHDTAWEQRQRDLLAAGAELFELSDEFDAPDENDHFHFQTPGLERLWQYLGERGCNEVHIEAGAKLNGSLLAAAMPDEIIHYLAPRYLGHGLGVNQPPDSAVDLSCVPDMLDYRVVEMQQLGDDIRLRLVKHGPTAMSSATSFL